MDITDLRAVVDERYAQLDLPSWPDPHPDLASPAEEEYSRVSDPGRYEVLLQRARVWVEVLCELDGVRSDEMSAEGLRAARGDARRARGVRLTSSTPGTAPFFVIERHTAWKDVDPPVPGVMVAVGEPDSVIGSLPQCGCDACDDGSEHLLDEVDDLFCAAVTTGPHHLPGGVLPARRAWVEGQSELPPRELVEPGPPLSDEEADALRRAGYFVVRIRE